jgi:hypothetical protein
MVELVVLQSLSYMAGALGVCMAALYYVMNLRVQQTNMKQTLETRQAQLFMQIYNKFTSEEGIKHQLLLWEFDTSNSTYEEWLEYYRGNPDYRTAMLWITYVIEGIGLLIREDLVNIRLVAIFMAGSTRMLWETFRDIVYKERGRREYRRFASEWEYTYNELMKYMKEHPELQT